MRSLGEFVGHIMSGVKADPTRSTREVRRTVEEEDRGGMILRRTTIDEVEVRHVPKTESECVPEQRSADATPSPGTDSPPADPPPPGH